MGLALLSWHSCGTLGEEIQPLEADSSEHVIDLSLPLQSAFSEGEPGFPSYNRTPSRCSSVGRAAHS